MNLDTNEFLEYIKILNEIQARVYQTTCIVNTFVEMCQNAETGEDLLKISDYYDEIHNKNFILDLKTIYNQYIGWPLSSEKACKLVVNTWKDFPNSKIIDVGAGTGLFCKTF